jgi:hypothetical protein
MTTKLFDEAEADYMRCGREAMVKFADALRRLADQ